VPAGIAVVIVERQKIAVGNVGQARQTIERPQEGQMIAMHLHGQRTSVRLLAALGAEMNPVGHAFEVGHRDLERKRIVQPIAPDDGPREIDVARHLAVEIIGIKQREALLCSRQVIGRQ
jgi:hypothetical protein